MSAEYPTDLLYTREHEWARVDGKQATVGITKFAVEQLGDITQVELPKEGETVRKDDVFGSVESVKAVSDLFAPVSGKIVKVNNPLADSPEDLNDEPYDEAWMIVIEMSNPEEAKALMDVKAYSAFLEEHANE